MYARSMAEPSGAARMRGVMYAFPSTMISSTTCLISSSLPAK
jgi:hypothetical protein